VPALRSGRASQEACVLSRTAAVTCHYLRPSGRASERARPSRCRRVPRRRCYYLPDVSTGRKRCADFELLTNSCVVRSLAQKGEEAVLHGHHTEYAYRGIASLQRRSWIEYARPRKWLTKGCVTSPLPRQGHGLWRSWLGRPAWHLHGGQGVRIPSDPPHGSPRGSTISLMDPRPIRPASWLDVVHGCHPPSAGACL